MMGLLRAFFSNTRKPEGWLGRVMVNGMNSGHAAVTDWGMGFLTAQQPARIADLGCGGGRNAARLLERYPHACLTALDYSGVSVAKTQQVNRAAIAAGRCTVLQGNVAALPFEAGTFDLITAIETVYFWPEGSFDEVFRTLKPGGTFLIVNESDGENAADEKWVGMIEGMTIYNADQLTDMLTNAGFARVAVHRSEKKHWLCLMAVKEA